MIRKWAETILTAFGKLPIETQRHIIDAAAKVFAEEGYHYASVANICAEAGISNGALYKYFKNKEMLFLTVIDYCTAKVEELYKKHFLNVSAVYTAIGNFLMDLADFSEEYKLYSRIYSDLGSSSMNRFAADTAEKFRKASSAYTVKMVQSSKERGEIKKTIETEKAAYLIDTLITVFSYSMVSDYQKTRFDSFFSKNGGTVTTADMIEQMTALLKQTLL